MSNMSYCRFHNTRSDLSVCLQVLSDDENLSVDEAGEGRRMFKEFLDFCRENDIITDYDSDELRNLFDGQTEKDGDE